MEKLDIEAAVETFKSVYRQEDINTATKEIILELECHPLSINILASTAFSNKWSLAQLQINWQNQSKSRLLETRKDRYHSVAVAINLSVSCSDFDENRDRVVKILRAIAFLPQGIHRLDMESIFQDDSVIHVAESLCRCSLANWRDERLVLLSPIRIYIAEQYNAKLMYDDELITSIRRYYYSRINFDIGHCAREGYANLDRIFLFDISQKFVQVETLQYLWNFAIELYNHNPQPMSVWSALERAQSEVKLDTFNEAKTEAMIWMSAIYAKMDHKRTSLEMIEAAKQFCRHMDGHKTKLAECLRDTGDIHRYLGKIAEAETCLREAHAICQELGDDEQENYVILCLSLCAIRKGDLSEATALLNLAENYFDPTSPVWATILLNKAQVGLLQSNFDQARSEIARAMENEEVHHGGIRRPLSMLKWKASDVESKAGAMQAAEHILAEATATEILPGQPDFMEFLESLRGRAYFAGIAGDMHNSRNHAERAILLASEGRSNNSYRRSLLTSGHIEMFAHEYSKARDLLWSALIVRDEESLGTTALVYRALGEVAALEKDMEGAERYFSKINSLCDEMGIPTRCLYNDEEYWYTLPSDRFSAWSSYLASHQIQM